MTGFFHYFEAMQRFDLNPPRNNEITLSKQSAMVKGIPEPSGMNRSSGETETRVGNVQKNNNKFKYAMKEAQKPFMGGSHQFILLAIFVFDSYVAIPYRRHAAKCVYDVHEWQSHHHMVHDDDIYGNHQSHSIHFQVNKVFKRFEDPPQRTGAPQDKTDLTTPSSFILLLTWLPGSCVMEMQSNGASPRYIC